VTQDQLTLFCFPCAGASAAGYLRWRRQVSSWLHIEPIELPGRGSRVSESPYRDFDSLVQRLTNDIALNLPNAYAFFGHSLGGLLAYGCAHRLRETGAHLPRAILTACSAAPSRRDDEHLARRNGDDELIKELRKLNGTPAELFEHPELLRMTLDLVAADFSVCGSYRHERRQPLDTKILVFGGRSDNIEEEALAAWQAESSFQTTLEMFDGGHFFMRDDEPRFLIHLQNSLQSLTATLLPNSQTHA
jgi:surfactin synthase thioesterase subunit